MIYKVFKKIRTTQTNQSIMSQTSRFNHVKRTKGATERPPAPPFAVINKIIGDRSGSMASFRGVQITMIKKLLKDTQTTAIKNDTPTYVTLTTFDNTAEHHLLNADIRKKDLPTDNELTASLYPRGTTRFIDTVLEAIEDIEKMKKQIFDKMSREVRNLNPSIVTIINCTTDGEDNVSEFTAEDLKEKMLKYRNNEGKAVLLAANMDAQEFGSLYGFSSDQSLTVHNSNPDSIEYAFDCVMQSSRAISSGGIATPYTQIQRSCSQGPINMYQTPIRRPYYNDLAGADIDTDTDADANANANAAYIPPMPPLPILRRHNAVTNTIVDDIDTPS